MAYKTLKELSRAEYEVIPVDKTWMDLEFGVMQRIADALEVMTKDKAELAEDSFALRNTNILLQGEIKRIQEREKKTEAYWRNAQAYGEKMARSRNGLRGYVGKLQKKLAGK
jgi:hypothetical protein